MIWVLAISVLLAATSLPRLDVQLATAFLAIGILGLVLKIPGILQNWALHPMMDGFNGGSNSGQSGQDAGGGSGGGDVGGGMGGGGDLAGAGNAGSAGGSQMVNGTIVTEESGTLLLLF